MYTALDYSKGLIQYEIGNNNVLSWNISLYYYNNLCRTANWLIIYYYYVYIWQRALSGKPYVVR